MISYSVVEEFPLEYPCRPCVCECLLCMHALLEATSYRLVSLWPLPPDPPLVEKFFLENYPQ